MLKSLTQRIIVLENAFQPLRMAAFMTLAECPFLWPQSYHSEAKLAERLLSQPSVFGWKMIFEASLACAMQTFQRPTASKVLNNSWQKRKTKDNSKQGNNNNNILEYLSFCYHKSPGVHRTIILLFLFRETEYQEWLSTAYLPVRKITQDFLTPKEPGTRYGLLIYSSEELLTRGSLETSCWECELSAFDSDGIIKMAMTSGKRKTLNSKIPKFLRWPPIDEWDYLTWSSDILLYHKSFQKT